MTRLLQLILPALAHASMPTLPMPARLIPANVTVGHGRNDVHDWLWLPRDYPENGPVRHLTGYWYHHTPEFGLHSPHDFELMVEGTVLLEKPVDGLPLPPFAPTLPTQYAFSPPSFSLDEVITGQLTSMPAKFTENSFDSLNPPIWKGNGTFSIERLLTVHYLYDSHEPFMPDQVYLSYPRTTDRERSTLHLYFLHLLWGGRGTLEAGPPGVEYDQTVHVTLDLRSCVWQHGDSAEDVWEVGATFSTRLPNDLLDRLHAGEHRVKLHTARSRGEAEKSSCTVHVVRELHCVQMPDSFKRCPAPRGLTFV